MVPNCAFFLYTYTQSKGMNTVATCIQEANIKAAQSKILDPLLFLIYIDDLTHPPTSDGSHSVLYTDDLLLFRAIKGQEDSQLLQDDISSIDKWVQQNHLTSQVHGDI